MDARQSRVELEAVVGMGFVAGDFQLRDAWELDRRGGCCGHVHLLVALRPYHGLWRNVILALQLRRLHLHGRGVTRLGGQVRWRLLLLRVRRGLQVLRLGLMDESFLK